ncbi:MAG: hypothetical protein LBH94_04965 [Deltaproteobacteria bacterium]|jgi:hypothetical protein|nr:hypothetical protein [Deltaproteobacteria bacterium]
MNTPAFHILQNLLNGGEISPEMHCRFDQPRYQSGAYEMLNAVPMPQGGATKRPGTTFCGLAEAQPDQEEAEGGGAARLVPFVYDGQHRMIELAAGRGRVWYPNGALVPGGTFDHPYESDELAVLRFAQSADVIYVVSARRKPAKISRYADDDWRHEVLSFNPKTPTPDAPTLATGGSGSGAGNQTYSYKIVAINPESGELSLPSKATDITCASLSQTYYVAISWQALPDVQEYRVYKKKSGLYGFIGRATDGATSFQDANITPDLGDTPPGQKTPFEEEDEYPTAVYFLQQRLGFAATIAKPLTVWTSQSANFENLAASTPPRDDDGIEATLAGERQTRILWCKSEGKHLVVGTAGGEWLFSPGAGNVITPASHGFNPQSHVGGQPGIDALRASEGVLFVQRGGGKIRLLGYSYDEDKFKPKDLSILASHILDGKRVMSWAWQLLPHGIVWMSLSDGTLAGLTLLMEHDVIGWHRHETDGFVEQVEVLPSAGGEFDLLWLLVRRNGKRFVEVMSPYFAGNDMETSFFVDSGLSFYGKGQRRLEGLEHLEGRSVQVFTDGKVHPPRVVKEGAIELEWPADVAHVGLPYAMRVSPTVPEPDMPDGSPAGRVKKISSVKAFLYQTLGLAVAVGGRSPLTDSDRRAKVQCGAQGNPLPAFYNKFSTQARDLPNFIENGPMDVSIAAGWSEDARLTFISDSPTPCSILAVVTTLELSGGGRGRQL